MATNALLERKGARTALITTAGFEDVIQIGRQNRRELYNLTPAPRTPDTQQVAARRGVTRDLSQQMAFGLSVIG